MIDFLIVGAGLFGATMAQKLTEAGKTVLVIDKRDHIGGNAYTENIGGINVHKYGAHIFHTSNEKVWNYVQRFAKFNRFTNSPIAYYQGELYSLPFNMHTFYQMWGATEPKEAEAFIEKQRKEIKGTPKNLEEQAISLVGRDIYERLIKGYTEKQWGRPCTELPPSIIKRLPVRFTYDNNYFNARYQGIPIGGYTKMVEKMLEGSSVLLGIDYLQNKDQCDRLAKEVIYTGPIDAYFDYELGKLEYRTLQFETTACGETNYQGVAVMNYTDAETPWTRIIEHKWFEYDDENVAEKPTIITREYSKEWKPGDEPYYPINDEKNEALAERYRVMTGREKGVYFGGRLGSYRYYDMDQVILKAFDLFEYLDATDPLKCS